MTEFEVTTPEWQKNFVEMFRSLYKQISQHRRLKHPSEYASAAGTGEADLTELMAEVEAVEAVEAAERPRDRRKPRNRRRK